MEGRLQFSSRLLLALVLIATATTHLAVGQTVEVHVTTGDQSKLLQRDPDVNGQGGPVNGPNVIAIDRNNRGQYIKGFGAALTNAAAYLFANSGQKETILQDLFGTNGIRIDYVRLVMGGSDFNAAPPYTYDDAGYEDFNMNEFSIQKDMDYVVPVLRDILRINPSVKLMASPWSAPGWMKNTNSLYGGQLKSGTQYLNAYAEYFVRFIRAYQGLGISIDTLTLQNEPEHDTNGYPTMRMPWDVQRDLIQVVGRRFAEEGISTQIIIWDHNWDQSWYPMNILNDGNARQYVGGTGWHCYGGNRYDPTSVNNAHPDKDMYFTECSGGQWDTNFGSTLGWNAQNLFIGQTRIGARTVLLWNLALDENYGPRVGANGCSDCRGVTTVFQSGQQYQRNVEYYSIGQFSKFVRAGAQRIGSTTFEDNMETVAFENPDGSIAVVVLNTDWNNAKSFQVLLDGTYYHVPTIGARTVITVVKRP